MISTYTTSTKSLSYWEYKAFFQGIDFTIVGAGLVGMSTAFHLKQLYPHKKIILIDKAHLSDAASFKNAGFACFGSAGELLADINTNGPEKTIHTAQLRIDGLKALDAWLGFKEIDFQPCGSYELFKTNELHSYQKVVDQLPYLNDLFKEEGIFKENVFRETKGINASFPSAIFNQFEGKIDTALLNLQAQKSLNKLQIPILKGIQVEAFKDQSSHVDVVTSDFQFQTKKLILATNGFSKRILPELNIEPARAQVLVTEPLTNLQLPSTYHMNEGFDYFRVIDNRILLGGGRNLDFSEENTVEFGLTSLIQDHLENLLNEHILPEKRNPRIDFRWSGIMGVGSEKAPLIDDFSDNISYGIRMGGMGVAIGSLIGKTLADRLFEKDKA